jgi:acyl carrier protein
MTSRIPLVSKFLDRLRTTPNEVPRTREDIRMWLVQRLAKKLRILPALVDQTRRFDQYGLDSLAVIEISGELEKLVERRLSPALLLEYPTINELSTHLSQELGLVDEPIGNS